MQIFLHNNNVTLTSSNVAVTCFFVVMEQIKKQTFIYVAHVLH